jgi:hypothetical protein
MMLQILVDRKGSGAKAFREVETRRARLRQCSELLSLFASVKEWNQLVSESFLIGLG